MYGLIHIAIRDFVILHHGDEAWQKIFDRTNADESIFNNMQAYDDSVTFGLVGATSEELNIEVSGLLEDLGVHWVLKTAVEGYGAIMDFGGANLPTFLRNLDALHEQVAMTFVDLDQPSFRLIDETESKLVLEYRSVRDGLSPFVVGLLKGLGQRFNEELSVKQISMKSEGADCDVFEVARQK
jgi:predicted hydrocarbon binding protein